MDTEKIKLSIETKVIMRQDKRYIPCHSAFEIATEHQLATSEVGRICDEMNIKIAHCQLGCF